MRYSRWLVSAFAVGTLMGAPALMLTSCVKTGAVSVKQPLEADLAQYEGVVVTASANNGENQEHASNLEKAVAAQAENAKTFKSVAVKSDQGDAPLELRLQVVEFQGGNKAARMFNTGGEAEIKVECELVDVRDNKVLTAFLVTGNSARKSKATVGGFDTSLADSLPGRAVQAASDEIVTYLGEKK